MTDPALPVVGNLAWAPWPSIDHIDILDRFNGVPTLGVVTGAGVSHLFWRVAGYVPVHVSCWVYVPLAAHDLSAVADSDGDLLDQLVFGTSDSTFVTVGVGWDYRLVFEREWLRPGNLSSGAFSAAFLTFVAEALEMKIEQGLPASRHEILRAASEAVREMATA